jgi:hypothetical protein
MATKTWTAWPDNPLWSWQVTRIIGLIDFGAANFTEIMEVVQRITPRDEESWHREWHRMGELVLAMARRAEAADNRVSARNCYSRATQYFRLSHFFLTGKDRRKLPTLRRMQDCFEAAGRYFTPPLEVVAVPYEGLRLRGYFLPALDVTGPAPTLIYLNGADSLSEEVYFTAGRAAQEFGYNFLMFNAPGVGLTLYELGLPTRPDCEKFVSPVVDYLEQRSEVDRERIGLIGESFAGYLLPRAAAMEKRIRAVAVWSPIYEWNVEPLWQVAPLAFKEHLVHLFGARDEQDLFAKTRAYTLEGVAGQLACPSYLLQGSEDWIIHRAIEAALRIAREAKGPATVRIVERDEGVGGVCHCQKDNLHVAHLETFNWFAETLGRPPKRPLTAAGVRS